MTDRNTPFNSETERTILSCFFTNPEQYLPDFMATMPPEAFYHAANRRFYDVLCTMHTAGKPIEARSVLAWMMQDGSLDAIGGPGEFAEIAHSLMQSDLYQYSKKVLRDLLMLRNILEVCNATMDAVYSHVPSEDANAILDQFEQQVIQLRDERTDSRAKSFRELVEDALTRYESAMLSGGALPGISTGFRRVDAATGGMREGQVWTFGGGTSDGKSAFMQNIIRALGCARVSTCIYTLEMTADENTDRFFCIQSAIPGHEYLYGLPDRATMKRAMEAAVELKQWPIHIEDVSGIKLSALRANMRAQVRRRKTRVFALDYLQLVSPDKKGHNREREVAEISAAMKADAKLLKVTIINLSQLNDDGKLRESRAVGMDSDVVGVLQAPEDEDTGERLEDVRNLLFSKIRGGPRGTVIPFEFHGPTYIFRETNNHPKPAP